MRIRNLVCLVGIAVLAAVAPVTAHEEPVASSGAPASDAKPGVKLESLLKTPLEGVDGTEVIVSRVTIPPHSSLPKHWHPGEEFGYVLEGSVILWQEGQEDVVAKAGDVAVVPLKRVHTAITTDEGATVLVFRVHEQGQPERVLVE